MARQRDYKREYARRKANADLRGISLSQGLGHAKRAKKRPIGELHIDLRFKSVKQFFNRFLGGTGVGQPLPDLGGDNIDLPPVPPAPPGVDTVHIFITREHRTRAVYPDGHVRSGSLDAIYDEAKRAGFSVQVQSGNPPKRKHRKK